MKFHVPSVRTVKLFSLKSPICTSKSTKTVLPTLLIWKNHDVRIRPFTTTISELLEETEKWYPKRKKMNREEPSDRELSRDYALKVELAWKNRDRQSIDQLFDEITRTGHFNRTSLHGIFNFYVEVQDVDAIVRFAETFHVPKQSPESSWYNRALSRLPLSAKQKLLAEMKKRNIPVSSLNAIYWDKQDTPMDFEQVIQQYKAKSSIENAIKLGKAVSQELKREEQNLDFRILSQLKHAEITIPTEVLWLLLRHAVKQARDLFAVELCRFMTAQNIAFDENQVYSLILSRDPYEKKVKTIVMALASLLQIKTACDRAKKDLAIAYVFRATKPQAILQQILNSIAAACPELVNQSLYQRLTLWGLVGNPLPELLGAHATLCQQAPSPHARIHLDLALLEICTHYPAADIAVKLAERIKSHEQIQIPVYSALFHSLLVAGQLDLFQKYYAEYQAISPVNAQTTALGIASRYGFYEVLEACITQAEQQGRILPPVRKYRMLLECAIRARKEELVEKIWEEYRTIQKDPITLSKVILFFKKDVKKAESLAEQEDHPLVHQAMVQVYIADQQYSGILRQWSKIDNPTQDMWIWLLKTLPDVKLMLRMLEVGIQSRPRSKRPLQIAAIVSLINRSEFDQAFTLLRQFLEDPGSSFVPPSVIGKLGAKLKKSNVGRLLGYFSQLEELCEQFPHTESTLALRNLKLMAERLK